MKLLLSQGPGTQLLPINAERLITHLPEQQSEILTKKLGVGVTLGCFGTYKCKQYQKSGSVLMPTRAG